ncbi:nitronate monooxygenase [Streptomyces sp. NPDC051020]|uniref:nitronate monooxygenase n=1 Tax=Streptomyces sp. NPDC051020 TaxID=3155409 RepID=UPI00341FCDC0
MLCLVVQLLLDRGIGAAGVSICAPPIPDRAVRRPMAAGEPTVDYRAAARAPLMLVAGRRDLAVPAKAVFNSAARYQRSTAVTGYLEYPAACHHTVATAGWEALADDLLGWVELQLGSAVVDFRAGAWCHLIPLKEVVVADILSDLGIALPVLAAPMSGGPTMPAIVVAAAKVGSVGFLAAGCKTAESLEEQITEVRAERVVFGVNLFVPKPIPISTRSYRDYARAVQVEADRYRLTLPGHEPVEDDDGWRDKVDLITAMSVPWVSFTFGIPDAAVIKALRASGCTLLQTVTTVAEARRAAEVGMDALVVQASGAGGHSATFSPERPLPKVGLPDLIAGIRRTVDLPVLAAGGIGGPADVTAALDAGAVAAMVGTLLLRTDESAASATHKAALANPVSSTTAVTRAFSGRPARGLRNYFMARYGPVAPAGYPGVHHLTSPLRKAAADAGNAQLVHLWAGTGYREARSEPAADTLQRLANRI